MRFALDNRVQGVHVRVFPGNVPRHVRMEHSTGYEKRFLVFLPEFATVAPDAPSKDTNTMKVVKKGVSGFPFT